MSLADRITDYLASGGLFNPEMANHEAVRDLLIDCRDVLASATPADVGEEPVAYVDADGNLGAAPSSPIADMIRALPDPPVGRKLLPLYSATALERVTRERDEARATLDEVCLSSRQEWQRATSAEAKLAEARKVIEWIRSEASSWAASYSFARRIADAARRWVEETR